MELTELAKLGTEIGLMATLVLFFSWQAWKRETRLADRVTTLETFINEKMSIILDRNTGVLANVGACLERSLTVIDRLEARIDREAENDRTQRT